VKSPSGSTLQCGRWLWDDMPLNSPKRPPYWISTSGFHFHTSPQSTCHSAPVSEILSKLDRPRKKSDVMSIFKIADLSHLGFQRSNNGFFEKPNYINSCRSSIDTIALNCSVFEKIEFFLHFGDRQTNRQTDGQHRCTKPLSLSRAAANNGVTLNSELEVIQAH